MTYPEHYLLAFGGAAYGSNEQWQCSIRMAGGEVDPLNIQDALTDVANDVKKFVQNSAAKFMAGYSLTYCKFNKIGADGLYADKANSYTYVYAPAVTGAGTIKQPPQVAVVVSLRTDAEYGRGSKGRFYWLGAGYSFDYDSASGGLTVAERDALAAAAATLIADLGDWPGLDLTGLAPAVVSGLGAGTWRHVSSVRVDGVFDTQRRRAKSLPRAFKQVVVP